MLNPDLVDTFRRGSRTFSLAARIFDLPTYQAACQLYAWCRHCDDQVDSFEGSPAELGAVVDTLRERTRSAFRGEAQADPAFAAFQEVTARYRIPESYALDLIEGMAMDARNERYEELEDLERYAYHVAGTVGLMMTYVLGTKSQLALPHAKSLGIAMQLTNISRDILEDSSMNRVYLPIRWLRDEGLTEETLALPANREKVARLADRLVTTAEKHYEYGLRGLPYLSYRSAAAIASAAGIYRAIGFVVKRRGIRAWDTRAVVPWYRKLWEITLAPWRARRFA